MDIGRITAGEVKDTLRAIRSGDPVDSELVAMNVVLERLRDGNVAPSREARAWALVEVLDLVTRASLIRLRGQAPASQPTRPSAAELAAAVRADFAADSLDLESWSCLHHRYLSPYPLQVQELASVVLPGSPHGRRLISRRLARGYTLLSNVLRDLEHQANRRASTEAPETPEDGAVSDRAADGIAVVRPIVGAMDSCRLPRWRTSLVGREGDLLGVTNALAPGSLVSLVGPPGVGKTRLSGEVAARLAPDCPDGVAFLDLVTLRDPELVGSTVAAMLGVPEASDAAATRSVVDALAGRRALVILDNCEHLSLACAALADALLDGCPELRLLATSRTRLDVPGERVWRLSGLAAPGDVGAPAADEAAAEPAVRLFVERATAVDQRFTLSAGNAAAIATICRRLDGLPLAIELAAARTAAVPVQALVERLGEVWTASASARGRNARDRESVHDTIRWSYRHLAPPHQAVFRRLGAFSGAWSLSAAEAVCAGGIVAARDVFGLLADLADKSLLVAIADLGRVRYRFLAPVAHVAGELLEASDEEVEVRDRHLAWFLDLAESAVPGLRGEDQATWLARVADADDNLGAAVRWACARPDRESALRATAALGHYWKMRGLLSEGRRHLAAALAVPGPDVPAATAAALEAAGGLARAQGDLAGARAHLEQAVELRRRLGDQATTGGTLRELGAVADEQGDIAEAIALFQRSLAAHDAAGDAWGGAAARNSLGLALYHQGDLDEAFRVLEACVAAFRQSGETWAVGVAVCNLGNVAFDRGDLGAAEAAYTESLAIARDLDDLVGVATSLTGLGHVALRGGDTDEAMRRYVEGGRILLEVDDRRQVAECLEFVAGVDAVVGREDSAVRLLASAGALRDEIGAPLHAKERSERSERLAALERRLGEAAYRRAWAEGRGRRWRDVAAEVFDSPSG